MVTDPTQNDLRARAQLLAAELRDRRVKREIAEQKRREADERERARVAIAKKTPRKPYKKREPRPKTATTKQIEIETRAAWEAVLAGSTTKIEAEKLGLTHNGLQSRFRSLGLMLRTARLNNLQIKALRARKLFDSGMATRQAAEKAGWPGTAKQLQSYWSRYNMITRHERRRRDNDAETYAAWEAILAGSTITVEAKKIGITHRSLRKRFRTHGLVATRAERQAKALKARELYDGGMTITQVVRAVEWPGTEKQLQSHWTRHGLSRRRNDDRETYAAWEAVEAGSTITAVAKKFGVAPATLAYRFKACGLKTNAQERYQEKQRVDTDRKKVKAERARELFNNGALMPEIVAAVDWPGSAHTLSDYWWRHKIAGKGGQSDRKSVVLSALG